MLRHIVMFRWVATATDDDRAAVVDGLAGLPGQIETIRGYRYRADAGLADDTWDAALVADFDDVDGYMVYRDHPAHQAVLAEHIRPILAEIARVQQHLD